MEAEVRLGHARTYLDRRTGEHFLVLLSYRRARTQTPQYGEKPRHSLLDCNSIQNIWCDPPPLACEFCIRARVMASRGAGAILVVLSGSVFI